MVESNKIGSLTKIWPSTSIKKDNGNKSTKNHKKKEEQQQESTENSDKDPGDAIIDEYV